MPHATGVLQCHKCDPSIAGIGHHLILWLCTFGDQAASKTQLHDMTEGNDVVERLIAIGRVALYLAAEI